MALGGFGHGAQFCHMCNSAYCMHTLNSAMAQQQMSRHDMERLYNQFAGAQIRNASQGNATTTDIASVGGESKKQNKKLLLLRK